MLNTLTAHFEYIITCPKCQNCWSASKEETFDLDIVSCSECGCNNLNISKRLEV